MKAFKTVVRDEAAEQRLRAERAEARLAIAEARAAYWKAFWLATASELDIREAREEGEERAAVAIEKLSEQRDVEVAEALARLKALGAKP